MKKSFIIFINFGYWLIYLLLVAVIISIISLQAKKSISLSIAILPLIFFCLAPNLFSFYSFYFLLFTKFLKQKKIAFLVFFGAVTCLISAFLAFVISFFVFGFNQRLFYDFKEFISLFISFFFIAGIHGIIALIIRGFITWFIEIKLKEELTQKNYQTEIALVKSQINPHFLFNTINNIDILIAKDPKKASEYLNKLSGILRYMLYETKTENILLSEELKYLEKYLELQKIRTTNPNYVNVEVVGNTTGLQIAPMIFFPFIENAFKHTENDKKINSINLKFTIKNSQLNFECKNTYQNKVNQKQEFGGLGNELIVKRLMLLYPNKHSLEIGEYDGIYRVNLRIDLE